MAFFKSLAGPGYVILNVIRVMNIIALLAVATACAVMLVKTPMTSNFFIFDAATHVVLSCISFFLIVSELNIFRGYFSRYWPLFAQDSGLVTLGMTMLVLGVATLGDLNNKALSEEALGGSFWRIVLAGGIVTLIFGVMNIILSFIFRDTQLGVTARHIRAHGAVAANQAMTRKCSQKSFRLGRKDSLPSYRTSSSGSVSMRSGQRFPVKISSPLSEHSERFSKCPSSPKLAVPSLAHHPAMYSDRV
ncbi:hypothetical protein VTO42DRAFT_6285 [Malbranchea cinnamomea]